MGQACGCDADDGYTSTVTAARRDPSKRDRFAASNQPTTSQQQQQQQGQQQQQNGSSPSGNTNNNGVISTPRAGGGGDGAGGARRGSRTSGGNNSSNGATPPLARGSNALDPIMSPNGADDGMPHQLDPNEDRSSPTTLAAGGSFVGSGRSSEASGKYRLPNHSNRTSGVSTAASNNNNNNNDDDDVEAGLTSALNDEDFDSAVMRKRMGADQEAARQERSSGSNSSNSNSANSSGMTGARRASVAPRRSHSGVSDYRSDSDLAEDMELGLKSGLIAGFITLVDGMPHVVDHQ